MQQDFISVRGARVHNLKNVNVDIPRDKLVVITGLSGSGKSSLAFDTIFAEGQRRYVESLSAYARQFLGQMEKPDVDHIDGLSPAISIDQKGSSHNPRSTVGTVTEIYDYLRLMFARIGVQYSPVTGLPLVSQTAQDIVDQIAALPRATRVQVLAPVIRDKKGHHQTVFEDVRKEGFVRVRVDGRVRDVNEDIELDRYKLHNIEVVVDRLVVPGAEAADADAKTQFLSRLNDSVETALKLGDGFCIAMAEEPAAGGEEAARAPRDILFSEKKVDPATGISYPDLEPKLFSFNAPAGACPECQGLGSKQEFDPALVVPNPELSIDEGALAPYQGADEDAYYMQLMANVCRHYGIPTDVSWRELTDKQRGSLFEGAGQERIRMSYVNRAGIRHQYEITWEGVIANLNRRYRDTTSDYIRTKLEEYMSHRECPVCHGRRLKPEVLAVRVRDRNIDQVTGMSIGECLAWIRSLDEGEEAKAKGGEKVKGRQGEAVTAGRGLSDRDMKIARQILKEIRARLTFLVDVGLDYLTLSRSATTLSGGESQRIRLATQVGSQLMGVLYVLDEPSIGLHQRDQARLISTLQRMRDLGNTVLVVEHDDDTMRAADWIIDMGPGAGEHGGRVIATGTPAQIAAHAESLTGAYLSGRKQIAVPPQRRPGNGKSIIIRGARENNLKGIDVELPLGKLVVVTGVSGSGKSSLIVECLYKRCAAVLNGAMERAGEMDGIVGVDVDARGRRINPRDGALDKIINIDQQPIGRTPRSNPATYTGLWTPLRDLFAELPESKMRGYKSGRFSFNVKGGRCEACEGQGQLQIQMQFMPDIYVTCDTCKGTRFNRETLQVRLKGKNIAEVLDMTVSEATTFFKDIPSIARKLDTLMEVGLGYVRLGQPATTLSGGEAQRVKLSRELSKRATGRTLYVLDEPSVGLHQEDVSKLIHVLQQLVDEGNTVVVIEHHLDIIKVADWIIDLGPEGGAGGGSIVTQGTPEDVVQAAGSYTGRFLKETVDRQATFNAGGSKNGKARGESSRGARKRANAEPHW